MSPQKSAPAGNRGAEALDRADEGLQPESTAPATLPVRPDAVPDEIKAIDRWVLWRWQCRDGKWTKPPLTSAGRPASSTDPGSWTTFEKALAAYQTGRYDGLGVALTGDDLVGVDLDHVRDPATGTVEWAMEIVAQLDSYSEVSPSGTGLRVLLHGKLPPGGRKRGPVETYDRGRYLTITGHRLDGAPATVEHRQAQLDAFHAANFPAAPSAVAAASNGSPALTDAEILELARNARNGAKFEALYHGDDSGHREDTSAGDLAFLRLLAFYAQDPGQLDRLYRGSSRRRPKWDEKHSSDGTTYGQKTIRKALDGLGETYSPAAAHPAASHPPPPPGPPPGSRDRTSWWPVDPAAHLDGVDTEPPPCLLTRTDGLSLLYPGTVNMLMGESESMKSWAAQYAAAQAVAAGLIAVYVDFESTAGKVYGRLRSLGAARTDLAAHFRYIRPADPLDHAAFRDLDETLSHKPRLIVIDGITEALELHGLDLRSNNDWSKFNRALPRRCADTGASVTLVDHTPKAASQDGTPAGYAIGAQHKRSAIDGAAYRVEAVKPFGRGQHGIARLTVTKDRPGHVRGGVADDRHRAAELHLRSQPDGTVHAELKPPGGPESRFRPTTLMERVSRLLEELPAGASTRRIYEDVTGKKDAVRVAVEVLVEEGYVTRTDGARNAVVHTSTRPYRASEDPRNPDRSTVPPPFPDRSPGTVKDECSTVPHCTHTRVQGTGNTQTPPEGTVPPDDCSLAAGPRGPNGDAEVQTVEPAGAAAVAAVFPAAAEAPAGDDDARAFVPAWNERARTRAADAEAAPPAPAREPDAEADPIPDFPDWTGGAI